MSHYTHMTHMLINRVHEVKILKVHGSLRTILWVLTGVLIHLQGSVTRATISLGPFC